MLCCERASVKKKCLCYGVFLPRLLLFDERYVFSRGFPSLWAVRLENSFPMAHVHLPHHNFTLMASLSSSFSSSSQTLCYLATTQSSSSRLPSGPGGPHRFVVVRGEESDKEDEEAAKRDPLLLERTAPPRLLPFSLNTALASYPSP